MTPSGSGTAGREAKSGPPSPSSARVVASKFEAGDGPNLAIWFDEVRDDVIKNAVKELEEISLRLAQSKAPVERESPPEIEELRRAVRARMAALAAKKKRR